ncbi:MAG: carbamate kinase [Candidatus Eisenbacteria sp.]|nr:carbamate kinase [Candidatus Eisenbacteria bacterium]
MSASVVVSLGGNALVPSNNGGHIEQQFEVTAASMRQVVALLKADERVVLTHGNGPIVGNILIRNEAAAETIPPTPLYICGADSQGGIGYMVQQVLRNLLSEAGLDLEVATIVTQVVVRQDDPGFEQPSKPIGPFYSAEEAETLIRERNWRMIEDSGRGWRRVVPSPEPQRIVEIKTIRTLIEAGEIVIAAGGGGVPVVEIAPGVYRGVEAVIDKDLASVVLAREVGARRLVIVTSVDRVAIHFHTPQQQDLDELSLADARRYYDEGHFPPGSMGPKILSAIRFLEQGGEEVLITSPERLGEAFAGRAGTRIVS